MKTKIKSCPGLVGLVGLHLLAAMFATITSPARAGVIINGSFETGDFSGWSVAGSAVWVLGSSPDIGNYSVTWNYGNSAPNASISQSFSTTPGQQYQLTFDYGTLFADLTQIPQTLQVQISNSSLGTVQDTNPTLGFGPHYQTFTHLFTATSTSSTLTFTDLATNFSTAEDGLLDAVDVVAVPEPCTTFFGLACVGVAAFHRRRKSTVQSAA